MSRNDIEFILKVGRGDILPHLCSLQRNSQATSASVETNFSVLGKLPVRGRNLKSDNVKHYVMLRYSTAESFP